MPYELQASIHVDAAPEEVHALLSDVTRTGEWSRQCHRCEWEDERRGVGARFIGHNRTPQREWETVSEVIADDPGEHFAWSVGPGGGELGFRLRAAGRGGGAAVAPGPGARGGPNGVTGCGRRTAAGPS